MRILYLHQYFVTPEMAGGTRSYEMARRWAREHEVHIITAAAHRNTDSRGWQLRTIEGVQVHSYPVPYSNNMPFRERLAAFAAFAMRAGRQAVRIGGDLVFATSTPLTIAIPGAYASSRLGVPMVFEVRDLWPDVPIAMGVLRARFPIWLARRLEGFAYKRSAQIIALSAGMADGVAARGYPREKIHVVPNSADIDQFSVAADLESRVLKGFPGILNKPLLVYCGTLGDVNAVGYLAQVAAIVKRQGNKVHFLVVGSGKQEKLVREQAIHMGVLGVNFWMHPSVPKVEIPSILRAATASCSLVANIPELWANSANKFFDSLAAGRPVVINHGGWQADLINNANCGLVLDPTDYEYSAERLTAFMTDEVRVSEAGKRALRLAKSQFDRDKLARKLLSVLAGVAA